MTIKNFNCYNSLTETFTNVKMKIFYVQCPKYYAYLCNPYKGAYLPAITMCQLGLYR
jgi:hypothetical protein